ncbi:MAG: HAD-IIIA family hydrolase [Planctomycetes bacterium]|jgi:histidinol-phosphate phosphatase family protein|nr:HAD-IIIA family hydrolase [Planctomycetota bacterium]
MAAIRAPEVARSGERSGFTAMVLVGGLGTRLRAAVPDLPKPLAPVGGEPFLTRVLDQLAAAGCTTAILCLGHRGAQIEQRFGREHRGLSLRYSVEPEPLGTAGALRLALLHCADDAVLVCNGDSYCDVDLRGFVQRARGSGMPQLVVAEVADTERFGRVELARDGRVRSLQEKGVAGAGVISAGIYWLPRSVLVALPPSVPRSIEHDVLPGLVRSGLGAHRAGERFLDIGVPADYARAEAFFAGVRIPAPRRRLLVVDRDGTLIAERHYLADPRGVELLPGVVDGLRTFQSHGYEVAVVTNQSGIGRGYFDQQTLAAVNAELSAQLGRHGIALRGIWHCPHTPDAGCRCRKPQPALLERALDELGYGKADCLVVGDKQSDIELGTRLGVRTALVRTGYGAGTERDGRCTPDLVVDDLGHLAELEVGR